MEVIFSNLFFRPFCVFVKGGNLKLTENGSLVNKKTKIMFGCRKFSCSVKMFISNCKNFFRGCFDGVLKKMV